MERFCARITAKKPLESTSDSLHTRLHRCLTTLDLTLLGIGSTVGSGIYVMTGIAAKELAGPAIVVSFVVAAVVIILAAICYTEFAARIPVTGASYIYAYLTLGELPAFLMGWGSIVAMIFGSATNARVWSAYLDFMVDGAIRNFTNTYIPEFNVSSPLSPHPDILAPSLLVILTIVVSLGATCSAKVTSAFAFLNVSILVLVSIVGFIYADVHNWTNPDKGGFMPFGWQGVLNGATACFWAFTGFEIIPGATEEAKNPYKSVPRAIGLMFLIVTLLYMTTASAVTLMTPFDLIDSEAPLPSAFAERGIIWAKYVVAIGPILGLTSNLLNNIYGFVRLSYALAKDGLFFPFCLSVNPRTKVPVKSTITGGIIMMILACFCEVKDLLGFGVVVSLVQFITVDIGVIILRYRPHNSSNISPSHEMDNSSRIFYDDQSLITNFDQESLDLKYDAAANGGQKYTSQDELFSEDELENMDTNQNNNISDEFHDSPAISTSQPIPQGGTLKPSCRIFTCIFGCKPGRWPVVATFLLTLLISFIIGFFKLSFNHLKEWWAIVLMSVLSGLVVFLTLSLMMHTQNTAGLKMKVPFVPIIPLLSIATCVLLIASTATTSSWVGLVVTEAIGLLFYFTYGIRHAGKHTAVDEHNAHEFEMDQSNVALLDSEGEENI